MKLLKIEEAKEARSQELARDVARTATIKETKATAERELNDIQARFTVVMAEQKARLATAESERINKIEALEKEIAEKAEQLKLINTQIDERQEKEDNLIDLLQEKIDSYTEKESALEEREKRCIAREAAIADQYAMIKTLSSDLTQHLQRNLTKQ